MKITVLDSLMVDDKIISYHEKKLSDLGHNLIYYKDSATNDSEIIDRISDSEVCIITNKKFSRNVIENTNLKLIDVAFTGVDHVNIDACNEKGIIIENASGYSDNSVAELTIGLVIGIYRKFYENRLNMYEQKSFNLMGDTINNKTVGIIGTGKIGIEVIKLFKAFNANIICYSRTKKKEVEDLGCTYVDIEYLLKNSDIISVHLPLNKNTLNFLDKEKLDLIRNDSILINCARGKIIDNDYLAYLLNNDKIRACGIDVFDIEPPLDEKYPLLKAKNTLLTNHVAYLTKEAMEKRCSIVFDNLYKYLDGIIQNKVN